MNQVKENAFRALAQTSLFLGAATLAGSKYFIKYFPKSSQNGLILSATIGNVLILPNQMHAKKHESTFVNLIHITATLILGAVISSFLAKTLKGRADIHLKAAIRLSLIEVIIVIALAILYPNTHLKIQLSSKEPTSHAKSFHTKLTVIHKFLETHNFHEKDQILQLIIELEINTENLIGSSQGGIQFMNMIYIASTEELENLLEIAYALTENTSSQPQASIHLTLRRNFHELCLISSKDNPDLEKFEELLNLVDCNSIVPGDALKGRLLHFIAKNGRALDCVAILAKRNANFNARDTWGNTPLIWAIANGQFSMAKAITQHSPLGTDFNIQGRGNTALHLAIAKGYTDHTKDGKHLSVSSLDLARLLIPLTNLTSGPNKNTPLHIACIRRDPDMIQDLLNGGANHNLKNSKGETPVDLLEKSYQEACEAIGYLTPVYIINRSAFETSKEACNKLFHSATHHR